MMTLSRDRNLTLAHAAMEHAIYFLELDAAQQATEYLEFASQQVRTIAEQWAEQSVVSGQ